MFRAFLSKACTVVIAIVACMSFLSAQPPASTQAQRGVQVASLHPVLVWHRTSPTLEKPDAPVLYQIQLTLGTPNTLPKYDASGRHFTNSSITDIGGTITVNGSVNVVGAGNKFIGDGSGLTNLPITGTNGGTVTHVSAGTGLSAVPNPITNSGTISLDTTFTDARYLQLSGGVVTGPVGFGATPSSQALVDINGTQTESSFNEVLLRIDGTLNSNPGNSYSTALGVYPMTTMTGYTNYNKGIDVALSSTGAQIAHSVVAVNVNQPSAVNGSDCVVSFGINVPNQSAPCSTPPAHAQLRLLRERRSGNAELLCAQRGNWYSDSHHQRERAAKRKRRR